MPPVLSPAAPPTSAPTLRAGGQGSSATPGSFRPGGAPGPTSRPALSVRRKQAHPPLALVPRHPHHPIDRDVPLRDLDLRARSRPEDVRGIGRGGPDRDPADAEVLVH